jgi:Xaa-Pro aminopeptidase
MIKIDKRIKRLRKELGKKGLDACLFINLHASTLDPNLYYFSGVRFLIHAGLLIPVDADPVLIVAKGDYERAKRKTSINVVKTENLLSDLPASFKGLKIKKVGVCGRFFSLEMIKTIRKVKIENIDETLYALRMIKDSEEIKKIAKAARITKKSIEEIFDTIKPGMREREIEAKLEFIMKNIGAEATSFPSIVLSGKRTCDPHGLTSNRKIKKGDLLLIDCGAKYAGYCSDITRVVVVDDGFNKQQREIYQIVKEAQREAINKIKPGITNFEVDKVARDVIKEYGYDMPHGTGHGFGLEIHEEPRISYKGYKGCKRIVLKENMVFTIEPAIYLENKFGIRIEDDVLVTGSGYKIL